MQAGGGDKFGDSIAEKFALQARLIPKHTEAVLNKTQKAEELDFWCIYIFSVPPLHF